MKTTRRQERGYVLLVSMGMLGLLSLLAMAFVTITRAEQQVSHSFVDAVRARMMAETGIEWAIGVMRSTQGGSPFSTPPEWNFPGPGGQEFMYYRDSTPGDDNQFAPSSKVLGMGIPLRRASRPSYLHGVTPPTFAPTANLDDQVISGYHPPYTAPYIPGAYAIRGDHFRLKVFDCTMKINLNMQAGTSLELMLVTLVQALYDPEISSILAETKRDPIPAAPGPIMGGPGGLAQAIIAFRDLLPGGAFSRKEEILGVPGMTVDIWTLLRDYVTVYGWPDDKVAKPVPGWPGLGYYDASSSAQGTWGTQPRYPINVNAAPLEVLTAALAGLNGKRMVATLVGPQYRTKDVYSLSDAAPIPASTYVQAKELAKAIVNRRRNVSGPGAGPFRNWREFKTFLDTQKSVPAIGAELPELAWANCNPNSLCNRNNPDLSHRWRYEKLSLTSGASPVNSTTEFCLAATGAFEIESLGRVMDQLGNIVGQYEIASAVQIFELVRQTTQLDFTDVPTSPVFAGTMSQPEATMVGGIQPSPYEGYLQLQPLAIGATFPFTPETATPFAGATSNEKVAGSIINSPPNGAAWGDVQADGIMCMRQRQREMQLGPGGLNADTGTVEIWVKFMTDPDEGSDEAVLYTIAPKAKGAIPPGESGVAWKLERFGNQIVSTRFWFVTPAQAAAAQSDPANNGPLMQSPYVLTYSERTYTVPTAGPSAWKAGQWHHIVHRWRDGIDQDLQLDLDSAPGYFTVTTDETKVFLGSTETSVTDNSTKPPTITITTTNKYKYITFTLASNEAAAQVAVGGYDYVHDPMFPVIKNTGTYAAGPNYRGTNATVDDVRILAADAGIAARLRYGGSGSFTQTVPLPVRLANTRARVGSLRMLCAYFTFYPSVDGRPSIPGSTCSLSVLGNAVPGGGVSPDGAALSAAANVTTNSFPYTMTVTSAGSYDSPIVDDLTFVIGIPPQFYTFGPAAE